MKLVVCVQEVPDTEAFIRIAEDQKSILENNIAFIMNPYDEYAVEEALKIREAQGGDITAVCVGPESSNEVLRAAIAVGVDTPIRVACENKNPDAAVTAKMLSEAVKDMGADLILLGKETIDDGSQALGPMMGNLLGIPSITMVTRLDVADGKVTAEREIEGGTEVVEAPLPCIVTAQKGLNEPRYPSLRGKMTAKKAEIEVKEIDVPEEHVEIVSMQYPPARGEAKVVGEGAGAVPELIRLLREEARVI